MSRAFLEMVRAATTAQLERFASVAVRNMKAGKRGWGDIWLIAEGELVARSIWG